MGSSILVERRTDQQNFAAKKQIRTEQSDYKIAMEEVMIMLKVDHPNIVRIEECFSSELK